MTARSSKAPAISSANPASTASIRETGHVTTLLNAGKHYFGEGMTFFGGHLYQMTWREHRVFVFDHDMHPLPELSNPREGWGLTHDDNELIASDGSSRLFFLSPKDFSTRRVLPVIQDGSYLENINELEYVQGAIWANVFEDWKLVRISPETGCVEATVDLDAAARPDAPGTTARWWIPTAISSPTAWPMTRPAGFSS